MTSLLKTPVVADAGMEHSPCLLSCSDMLLASGGGSDAAMWR